MLLHTPPQGGLSPPALHAEPHQLQPSQRGQQQGHLTINQLPSASPSGERSGMLPRSSRPVLSQDSALWYGWPTTHDGLTNDCVCMRD